MMPRKRLVDRLDDVARLTGVPSLLEHRMRRRHLRWIPLIAVVLAGAGVALPLLGLLGATRGYWVLFLGFMIANGLPAFGPLKPWGEMADERERELRRSAYFVAFATASAVALIGLFTIVAMVLLQNWPRMLIAQLVGMLALLLLTLINAVPTLYASWATEPLSGEEV